MLIKARWSGSPFAFECKFRVKANPKSWWNSTLRYIGNLGSGSSSFGQIWLVLPCAYWPKVSIWATRLIKYHLIFKVCQENDEWVWRGCKDNSHSLNGSNCNRIKTFDITVYQTFFVPRCSGHVYWHIDCTYVRGLPM